MEICERTGKVCYSQKEAGKQVHGAMRHSSKKQVPLRSYMCKYCGTYHLTHYKNAIFFDGKSTKKWYKESKQKYKEYNEEYEELKK